jgi:hypothetical protein
MAQNDWKVVLRDAPVVKVAKKAKKKGVKAAGDQSPAKKKERHTPGLMQALGVGERRIVRGVAQAAASYAKRSKKAAESARDGGVKEAVKNVANAQKKALSQIAKIPGDLTKSREYRRATKQVRRNVRRIAW